MTEYMEAEPSDADIRAAMVSPVASQSELDLPLGWQSSVIKDHVFDGTKQVHREFVDLEIALPYWLWEELANNELGLPVEQLVTMLLMDTVPKPDWAKPAWLKRGLG